MSTNDALDGRLTTSLTPPTLDVSAFTKARAGEHHEILGERLVHLRQLAEETAGANANIPELAAMDQKIALLCNDLGDCFGREESMVFPSLLRLNTQTSVSKCQAGMVRARLRFMVAEQEALVAGLNEACDIARKFLSPVGPCEFCHELLAALEGLTAELNEHLRREQEELFAWALAREDWLIRKISADEDERCL